MKSLNHRPDRNFADQFARECQRHFRMSSARFYSQADKVRKPIVLAAARSRADLNKAASRVLQSPRRLASDLGRLWPGPRPPRGDGGAPGDGEPVRGGDQGPG